MARVSILLLTCLLTLLGGPVHANPRVVAIDESVDISLTHMSPLNPQPGTTLRLSGRLRNRGEQQLSALQVRLLLSTSPLATRSEIGTVAAGGADRDGPPTLAVSQPIAQLAPQAVVDWSLQIPMDSLPLAATGVYVAGLEVIGTGVDGLVQRVGLTRTFLPWFPPDSVQPARLVWLWPMTASPARALDGVQLNEQTAAELAPGGRLAQLVEEGAGSKVTWVLDPALLQTAEDMTDGYQVVGTSEPRVTGGGSAQARDWLTSVKRVTQGSPTVATSYALPDVMALERADMVQTIAVATQRAAADVSAATGEDVEKVLAWPPGGALTPSALRSLSQAGATSVLMADTAVPPTPAVTYTPDAFTSWAGIDLVLADSGLSAALAMPQANRGEALLARQRFLAEIAMTAGELPDAARSIVAAPDPLWNPRASFVRQTLRALQDVPYARLVGMGKARRQSLDLPRSRVPYTPAQRAAELPSSYMSDVRDQQRAAARLQAILTEPAIGYDESVARQTSGLWRANLPEGASLVRLVSEQVRAATAGVRVATTGTFTLPGDTGRIPVTVANDLDQEVTVGIRLESDQPARLSADEIEPFEVPAGRKVSLEVEATVAGAGTLPVKIQLTTPTGRRYGQPVEVLVRTTAYSQAAAYVVTGAFVILAFLLGMNFVRRRRARHTEHERSEHAHE